MRTCIAQALACNLVGVAHKKSYFIESMSSTIHLLLLAIVCSFYWTSVHSQQRGKRRTIVDPRVTDEFMKKRSLKVQRAFTALLLANASSAYSPASIAHPSSLGLSRPRMHDGKTLQMFFGSAGSKPKVQPKRVTKPKVKARVKPKSAPQSKATVKPKQAKKITSSPVSSAGANQWEPSYRQAASQTRPTRNRKTATGTVRPTAADQGGWNWSPAWKEINYLTDTEAQKVNPATAGSGAPTKKAKLIESALNGDGVTRGAALAAAAALLFRLGATTTPPPEPAPSPVLPLAVGSLAVAAGAAVVGLPGGDKNIDGTKGQTSSATEASDGVAVEVDAIEDVTKKEDAADDQTGSATQIVEDAVVQGALDEDATRVEDIVEDKASSATKAAEDVAVEVDAIEEVIKKEDVAKDQSSSVTEVAEDGVVRGVLAEGATRVEGIVEDQTSSATAAAEDDVVEGVVAKKTAEVVEDQADVAAKVADVKKDAFDPNI